MKHIKHLVLIVVIGAVLSAIVALSVVNQNHAAAMSTHPDGWSAPFNLAASGSANNRSGKRLYDQAVREIESENPKLNPDSSFYDPELAQRVRQQKSAYMERGIGEIVALRRAVLDFRAHETEDRDAEAAQVQDSPARHPSLRPLASWTNEPNLAEDGSNRDGTFQAIDGPNLRTGAGWMRNGRATGKWEREPRDAQQTAFANQMLSQQEPQLPAYANQIAIQQEEDQEYARQVALNRLAAQQEADQESAQHEQAMQRTPHPRLNVTTSEVIVPAGPNFIGTRSGTVYVPAGPNGVINTQTGIFHPTN